jgi:hypothetical protein
VPVRNVDQVSPPKLITKKNQPLKNLLDGPKKLARKVCRTLEMQGKVLRITHRNSRPPRFGITEILRRWSARRLIVANRDACYGKPFREIYIRASVRN